MFRKVLIPVVAAGSLLASASQVYALQEGDFAIKAGASYIKPDDLKIKMKTSHEHYKATTDEEWAMDISALMMATDDFGIEVGTYWPTKFKSKLKSPHTGKVDYKMMPITATAQFYMMDKNEPIRPYIGAGAALTRFSSEKFKEGTTNTKLKIDDNWGWTFQAGAVFDMDDQLFIDASARYVAMELKGKIKGTNGGKFKKSDLDPWIFSINGGIRF
ncbi:outer membrane protein OmpW [Kistimonas scapharcae]|uniref:Outer membrane protein OmpW n=1 Tax=Kistimonas scapharcae TaxID=1036133 RepID=A0ABP8V5G1_9GAMM